jgi:hypothetical protein
VDWRRDGKGWKGWVGNWLTAGEDDPFDVCFVGEFVPDFG